MFVSPCCGEFVVFATFCVFVLDTWAVRDDVVFARRTFVSRNTTGFGGEKVNTMTTTDMRIGQDAAVKCRRLGMPATTPWGAAQGAEGYGDGVVSVHTAGHGGFWLSEDAWRRMPRAVRDVSTFAGGRWYEEDEDWALVAVGLHQHFDDERVFYAVRTVLGRCTRDGASGAWQGVRAWLTSDDTVGRAVWTRYERVLEQKRAENAYQVACLMTPKAGGEGWDVVWRPVLGDGPTLVQRNVDYPSGSMPRTELEEAGAVVENT